MSGKTLILLGGPTASGKTALAIELARALGTEIISADSRQCYRELRIGAARPQPEELAAVKHHFIASHSIKEHVTAATFEAVAIQTAEELFKYRNEVVVAGGTGLYLRALAQGLDPMPHIPEEIRKECRHLYEQLGLEGLQKEVAKEDPRFMQGSEQANPHRLLRALEVVRATGSTLASFQKGAGAKRPFSLLSVYVDLPRETLYTRINDRVEAMMEAGLLEEVTALLPFKEEKALQTVGYAELFQYLEGGSTLEDAVRAIQQHTRNYAKRQITWFRNDGSYLPMAPDALVSGVLEKLRS